MKTTKSRYLIVICIGILVMSTGTVFNFFIKLNENMIDFLKGLGIALVLAGFFSQQEISIKTLSNLNCYS
jgi:hypothetical protein